jgi:hypothetical protein
MRARGFIACVGALCAATFARAEIVKFSESSTAPFAEQDKSANAYVRSTLDIEGSLDAGEPSLAALDKSLVGKDGRVDYKLQAVLLKAAKPPTKGATLLVETEPETSADASDLIDVARQRHAAILFLSSDFDAAAEPLRAAVLRDLVSHMRKSYGVAHVIGRGAERKAELLQNVATRFGADRTSGAAVFDGLLLHDRTLAAPLVTTPISSSALNGPFVIETFGSSVYWRSGVKFAAREVVAQANPRRRLFFLAGIAARAGARSENCAAPVNMRSIGPAMRALFVALDEWVSKGVAAPSSRIPSEADRTLVAARDLRWPKFIGLDAPAGDDRRAPAIDPDGNEIGGLRLPDQAVAIATFTGWNEQRDKAGPPCEAYGASLPFAVNKAERDKSGDPRPSLQERFGLRDFYVATVRVVADKLVKERLLLKQDADAYVAAAKKAPF